jgi:hypothetical protein
MIDVKGIIDSIKSILDSEKRFLIISWLFLGVAIAFLYNENSNLATKISEQEKTCSAMIVKSQEACQEQINTSRARQQLQLDLFVEQSNKRIDSLYNQIYISVRSSNQKVKKNIIEINELKDESNN